MFVFTWLIRKVKSILSETGVKYYSLSRSAYIIALGKFGFKLKFLTRVKTEYVVIL